MKTKLLIQMLMAMSVIMVGLTGFAAPAAAEDITVEVRSIEASREDGGLDPKLGDLQGTLDVTFAGYSSFRQLSKETVVLEGAKPKEVALPNDSKLTLTFHGFSDKLVKLGLGISDKMNTTLRVSPGSHFFQAGMRYKKGILILAIKVIVKE